MYDLFVDEDLRDVVLVGWSWRWSPVADERHGTGRPAHLVIEDMPPAALNDADWLARAPAPMPSAAGLRQFARSPASGRGWSSATARRSFALTFRSLSPS
ncbi:MAG: hypothetical protein HPM95_01045 [Alphaproteobacteria bacterium]|nr:hypothetical protein [Alphaproteobacteria bacterium]